MFNILIVDDDPIVLECLNRFVNWESLGFKVIGTALSAVKAISIIETEYVDVIITDISMPGKDGLELIKDAMEINPYLKTVILSSYIEFNYAKEAMKLGSFDYLTKPVNYAELNDICIKLKAIMEKEVLQQKKQSEFLKAIRAQFMNNLVKGYYQNMDKLEKKALELDFELYTGDFCLIRMLLKDSLNITASVSEDDYNQYKLNILEKTKDYLNSYGKAFLIDNSSKELAVLFFPSNIDTFSNIMEKFTDYINEKAAIYVGVGCIYQSLMDAPKSFQEAGKALEYRYIKKQNYLYYKHLSEFFKGRSIITSEVEDKIYEYLANKDSSGFTNYIFEIVDDLYRIDDTNKGLFYDSCIEILLIINRFLMNYKTEDKSLQQSDYTAIRALLKKESYHEIKAFITDYLKESMAIVCDNQEKPMGAVIESVIKYINEHYSEDITLQKLSEIAYLHPIYLCRLFKERMGENFMDYLMKVRIEAAKKLLCDLSLRIYDICEMVGYESPQYFSKIFKETAGISPKDFRKKYHAI